MKLKGEKELIAEELYNSIEEELYNLTKQETAKAGDLVDTLITDDYEKLGQILEEVYSSNSLLYTYRRTAEALLQGDFTLNEIKVLHEYSKQNNCLRIVASVVEDNKKSLNINNIEFLGNFIKTLVLLKAKELEMQAV